MRDDLRIAPARENKEWKPFFEEIRQQAILATD
jgi:hypothetical protein